MKRHTKHGGDFSMERMEARSCGYYVAIEFQRAHSRALGGRHCICSYTLAWSCI